MIPDEMIAKICAALFLLGDNVSIAKLKEIVVSGPDSESEIKNHDANTLGFNQESIDRINVGLAKFGLQVILSNDQIQMTTISTVSGIVKAIKLDEVSGDLTPAALQVMTIVTYLPGSNKSDISYIRGAQSATSIRSLLTRGLVHKKDEKFYPTPEALQHLGVAKVEDLPEYAKLSNDFKEKLNESLQDEN